MTRLSVRAVELQIIISAMKLSFSKGDKIATKGKTTSLLTSRKMQFELSHVLPILAHLTFFFHLLIQSGSLDATTKAHSGWKGENWLFLVPLGLECNPGKIKWYISHKKLSGFEFFIALLKLTSIFFPNLGFECRLQKKKVNKKGTFFNYRVFRNGLSYFGSLDCQQGLSFCLKMGHVHVL